MLAKNKLSTTFGHDTYNGHWKVLEVCNNDKVEIQKGPITDTYNIRNITPYKS